MARFRDRNDAVGNVAPEGERVVGEPLVEYAPRIVDIIPEHAYSGEAILELHRQRNAMRVPPPPRPGVFRTHSRRRGV